MATQNNFDIFKLKGTWVTQSVERMTLDLGVVSLGPMLGIGITFNKRKKEKINPNL